MLTIFLLGLVLSNQPLAYDQVEIGRLRSIARADQKVLIYFLDAKGKSFKLYALDTVTKSGVIIDRGDLPISKARLVPAGSDLFLVNYSSYNGINTYKVTPENGLQLLSRLPDLELNSKKHVLFGASALDADRLHLQLNSTRKFGHVKLLTLDKESQKVTENKHIQTEDNWSQLYVGFQGRLLHFSKYDGQVNLLDPTTYEVIKELRPKGVTLNLKPPNTNPSYAVYFMNTYQIGDQLQIEFADLTRRDPKKPGSHLKVMTIDKDFKISFNQNILLHKTKEGSFWITFPEQKLIFEPAKD